LRNLKFYIEETVFPKLTGHIKKDTICEKTCQNYMGFKYNKKKEFIMMDMHKRPDVVAYRNEWLKRIFEYRKSMKDFDGDMLDVILESQLKLGEKELVQVTHDKCHFYANNRQQKIWIREDKDILRSKHIGRSIMVSAFLCSCYGLLQTYSYPMNNCKQIHILGITERSFCSLIYTNRWLVHQAIPIFELLHSGCIGVFCFDQSINHNAMAADALIASKMNLS
ncbi:hypothetical protein RhiirA4_281522, partial [Rhizophagus irregularis]